MDGEYVDPDDLSLSDDPGFSDDDLDDADYRAPRDAAADDDDDYADGRSSRSRGIKAKGKARPSGAAGTATRRSKGKGKEKAKDGYAWEATYKRSWDVVKEDESGSLEGTVRQLMEANKRKRTLRDTAPIQRGIIRHLILVLDLSASMLEKDLRPTRFELMLQYAREFVAEYFDQNPIGQLAIIGTREGIAERIAPMGGNTTDHVSSLMNKRKLEPRGEPSLQNALEQARALLTHLPTSNSREVLVVFGSLTTCDPGNVHDTIDALARDKVRVSVVALAAEVKVCREACERTGGTFGVALDEVHFKDLLFETVPPPAVRALAAASAASGSAFTGGGGPASSTDLLLMGFPVRLPKLAPASMCACHSMLKGGGGGGGGSGGYLCPRCGSKVCEVPTDCPVCGLTIVMSTHLARSYHHLFPVPNWVAVDVLDPDASPPPSPSCYACDAPFPIVKSARPPATTDRRQDGHVHVHGQGQGQGHGQAQAQGRAPPPPPPPPDSGLSATGRYACPRCGRHFCLDCDAFVHDVLHCCPGCGG